MNTVRDRATVTVTEHVDGSPRRKARAPRRQLATSVESYTVDPAIMAAARAALRPGERLVIVGPNEVRTAYA